MRMRAFTLAELAIVVAIIAISAAVATPNIAAMVKAAKGESALRENAAAVAFARDTARGQGMCLDYILRRFDEPLSPTYPPPREPPLTGPYLVDIWIVPCPDDPPPPAPQVPASHLFTRTVSDTITALCGHTLLNGIEQLPPIDRVHFSRDGSLHSPISPVLIKATVNNVERKFRIYPAAGTIEIDEAK